MWDGENSYHNIDIHIVTDAHKFYFAFTPTAFITFSWIKRNDLCSIISGVIFSTFIYAKYTKYFKFNTGLPVIHTKTFSHEFEFIAESISHNIHKLYDIVYTQQWHGICFVWAFQMSEYTYSKVWHRHNNIFVSSCRCFVCGVRFPFKLKA